MVCMTTFGKTILKFYTLFQIVILNFDNCSILKLCRVTIVKSHLDWTLSVESRIGQDSLELHQSLNHIEKTVHFHIGSDSNPNKVINLRFIKIPDKDTFFSQPLEQNAAWALLRADKDEICLRGNQRVAVAAADYSLSRQPLGSGRGR